MHIVSTIPQIWRSSCDSIHMHNIIHSPDAHATEGICMEMHGTREKPCTFLQNTRTHMYICTYVDVQMTTEH